MMEPSSGEVFPARVGTPGGVNFAYLAEHNDCEVILYAATMSEALGLYRLCFTHEPYSIRQMADNE